MDPVGLVMREARGRGLNVARTPLEYAQTNYEHYAARRWLLINGNQCQVATTGVKMVPNTKGDLYRAFRLYAPRTDFAEFIIYVVTNGAPGDEMFYIVPRDRVNKDTWRRPGSQWLEPFRTAWNLLVPRAAHRGRRFPPAVIEELPKHTAFVIERARRAGLSVKLFRQKKHNKPASLKERLVIDGRRCQVMIAGRLSATPDEGAWQNISVRACKSRWNPEFVVYVDTEPEDPQNWRLFLVPRWPKMKDTTTTLTGWIAEYEEAWRLLKDPSIPVSSGIVHRLE